MSVSNKLVAAALIVLLGQVAWKRDEQTGHPGAFLLEGVKQPLQDRSYVKVSDLERNSIAIELAGEPQGDCYPVDSQRENLGVEFLSLASAPVFIESFVGQKPPTDLTQIKLSVQSDGVILSPQNLSPFRVKTCELKDR